MIKINIPWLISYLEFEILTSIVNKIIQGKV